MRKGATPLTNPDPDLVPEPSDELILIGNLAAEEKFFRLFCKTKRKLA